MGFIEVFGDLELEKQIIFLTKLNEICEENKKRIIEEHGENIFF